MSNKIFLLRHGESFHNVAMKEFMSANPDKAGLEWWEIEDAYDPAIRDAALTSKGIKQAESLQNDILQLDPSLLILSPLTRNLQTANVACQKLFRHVNCDSDIAATSSSEVVKVAPEVIISPLLREHTYSTCDIGSSPERLVSEWPQWADKGLYSLSDMWWAHAASASDSDKSVYREPWQHLQSRTAAVASFLAEQTINHECILVVGHAVLFYALTGKWMANCQLVELDLAKLRPHCACAGLACRCEMDFNCQTHT